MIKKNNKFQSLFDRAAEHGISKYRIGVARYGEKNYTQIYQSGWPTPWEVEEYQKLAKIVDRLIKEKECKK